jgi:hypothetical protein
LEGSFLKRDEKRGLTSLQKDCEIFCAIGDVLFPDLKEGTQLKIVIKGKELEFSWDKNG